MDLGVLNTLGFFLNPVWFNHLVKLIDQTVLLSGLFQWIYQLLFSWLNYGLFQPLVLCALCFERFLHFPHLCQVTFGGKLAPFWSYTVFL